MTFVQTYTKSNIWKGNEYLVNPFTAVKRCACCKKLYFSIEFCDHDYYDDHKIPVCNKCVRKRGVQDKVKKALTETVVIECKSCNKTYSIANFLGRRGDWYDIKRDCENCRSMPKVEYTS